MPDIRIIEIKARRRQSLEEAHEQVLLLGARYIGEDHQVDTYFRVPQGRLKVRKGPIENSLIYYERQDQPSAKRSTGKVAPLPAEQDVAAVLATALGILVEVEKKRRIYFLDQVKIHLDEVRGLGSFLEIEVMDPEYRFGEEELRRRCAELMARLGVSPDDLVSHSYSDLLLERKQ